jgi:Icc-related predicted phosphoesterase
MKICAISDLHGYLPKVEDMPLSDVVCIAGDISPLRIQRNKLLSAIWFGNTFIPWCESLPCVKVILVAGNHDFFLEDYDEPGGVTLKLGRNNKLIYLRNSSYKYGHKTFYGTPHITDLPRWAFSITDEEAHKIFSRIPNCDVLITHTPPFDAANTGTVFGLDHYPDYGSYALRGEIIDKNIDLIICGHVHTGNHELSDWGTHKIVNVSYLDEDYRPIYSPKLITI